MFVCFDPRPATEQSEIAYFCSVQQQMFSEKVANCALPGIQQKYYFGVHRIRVALIHIQSTSMEFFREHCQKCSRTKQRQQHRYHVRTSVSALQMDESKQTEGTEACTNAKWDVANKKKKKKEKRRETERDGETDECYFFPCTSDAFLVFIAFYCISFRWNLLLVCTIRSFRFGCFWFRFVCFWTISEGFRITTFCVPTHDAIRLQANTERNDFWPTEIHLGLGTGLIVCVCVSEDVRKP